MDHFKAKFLSEARDLIQDLEVAVLELENNSADMDCIEKVFRVMHTFKGNSTMFGFDKIGDLTHHLETIYDLIRNEQREVDKKILNVTLRAVDHIRILLVDELLTDPENQKNHAELTKHIMELVGNNHSVTSDSSTELNKNEDKEKTYLVRIKPHQGILLNGANPLFLVDDLFHLGTCKALPRCGKVQGLKELEATQCYISWDVILSTKENEEAIKDVFIFVEDECDLEIIKFFEGNIFHVKECD